MVSSVWLCSWTKRRKCLFISSILLTPSCTKPWVLEITASSKGWLSLEIYKHFILFTCIIKIDVKKFHMRLFRLMVSTFIVYTHEFFFLDVNFTESEPIFWIPRYASMGFWFRISTLLNLKFLNLISLIISSDQTWFFASTGTLIWSDPRLAPRRDQILCIKLLLYNNIFLSL